MAKRGNDCADYRAYKRAICRAFPSAPLKLFSTAQRSSKIIWMDHESRTAWTTAHWLKLPRDPRTKINDRKAPVEDWVRPDKKMTQSRFEKKFRKKIRKKNCSVKFYDSFIMMNFGMFLAFPLSFRLISFFPSCFIRRSLFYHSLWTFYLMFYNSIFLIFRILSMARGWNHVFSVGYFSR